MATRTENVVKFGCVLFEICEWTDIQTEKGYTDIDTDMLIAILCTIIGGKVITGSPESALKISSDQSMLQPAQYRRK